MQFFFLMKFLGAVMVSMLDSSAEVCSSITGQRNCFYAYHVAVRCESIGLSARVRIMCLGKVKCLTADSCIDLTLKIRHLRIFLRQAKF